MVAAVAFKAIKDFVTDLPLALFAEDRLYRGHYLLPAETETGMILILRGGGGCDLSAESPPFRRLYWACRCGHCSALSVYSWVLWTVNLCKWSVLASLPLPPLLCKTGLS